MVCLNIVSTRDFLCCCLFSHELKSPSSMISNICTTLLYVCIATFSVIQASPIQDKYAPEGGSCHDYDIPINIGSENFPWIAPKWTDNLGFVDLLSAGATRTTANFPLPLGAPVHQTAAYRISATFCTPKKQGKHAKTVLLATHGLGFDRSYWNSPYKPEKYNFAEYALDRGYSIFFYDRLGVGQSSKYGIHQSSFKPPH